MSSTLFALGFVAIFALIGFALGYFVRLMIALADRDSVEMKVRSRLLEAREEVRILLAKATEKAEVIRTKAEELARERKEELTKRESLLLEREENLRHKEIEVSSIQTSLEERELELQAREAAAARVIAREKSELERIASLSQQAAKQELFKDIERDYQQELSELLRHFESKRESTLEERARDILTLAVQRLASSTTPEVTTSHITLPREDDKGKIIGKDGRNIRAFERAAGVELLIDDSPSTIAISSFDPVRREVARRAMETLLKDGRIQPARIESTLAETKEEVEKSIKEQGENAAFELGLYELNPKLISIMGRLHFRTSYGQNVLAHSVEVAKLCGLLADELGANRGVALTAGFLHDIGKAMDQEHQGSHVTVGVQILERFEVEKTIIEAMKSHHEDFPYTSLEGRIVQTADTISAARPGARRENVEQFLRRLQDLEAIAVREKGVESAYAIQAGRELRVFVNPGEVGEYEARRLAERIADKISAEVTFPGEIAVTVIREERVVEIAR